MFFFLFSLIVSLTEPKKVSSAGIESQEKVSLLKVGIPRKPLKTLTPKPSITKFRVSTRDLNNLAQQSFPQEEIPQSLTEEIKTQLTSTPMIIFYIVLGVCVLIVIGVFMFYNNSDDDADNTQDAIIESQYNEHLDPQLKNESPLQI